MSFLSAYFGIPDFNSDVPVLCPFPHHTGGAQSLEYQESHPSAHVNTEKGLFHCKACDTGLNEVQFIERILNCTRDMAEAVRVLFIDSPSRCDWRQARPLDEATLKLCESLGINESVAKDLNIAGDNGTTLYFPVFMYDQIVDIRQYIPGESGDKKIRSQVGARMGMVIPYDNILQSNQEKVLLLCAGEKDMAVAASNGFQACTITGGENTPPKILNLFHNRKVAILYDNDSAGKTGARRVAKTLQPVAQWVKVVEKHHEICKEKGEDITDFFTKYHKTAKDLIACIEETAVWEPDEEPAVTYPFMDLATASQAAHLGELVCSNIQVVSVNETSFMVPTEVILKKASFAGRNNTMAENACKEWALTYDNVEDILHLIDNNFREDQIKDNLKKLAYIPFKETGINVQYLNQEVVHKAYVTDMFETAAEDIIPMEYTAYSLKEKLESGQKYLVTYKIVPHPYKGSQLTMLIINAVQAIDSVTSFEITPQIKEHLKVIQDLPGTVQEKCQLLSEKAKGLLGYNGNNTLIQAIDFAYHTPLSFNFGRFQNVRGYLDTLLVGESRTGKSSTAAAFREAYGLGVFASLAGNAATMAGLIGGSSKAANGSFQTRAGLIPQNHKGLIIFEELGKCQASIIRELTDIRSSNEVRITRVSGTITMPAVVRMITLSNVKNTDKDIRSIASYPNGIEIITELIGSAEDIARYDLMVVLADRGNSIIDPLWEPQEALPLEVYRARVRWVWSRTASQIIIAPDISRHLILQANALNELYDSHIKIFGTEAWKKIARLAIAIAGYLVSTDEHYQNLIVKKEHVDYAVAFFNTLYNNNTFKLKEYVEQQRLYTTVDNETVQILQDIYNSCPALMNQLERVGKTNRNMLMNAAGLTSDELSNALRKLSANMFVILGQFDIVPTERFRIGMTRIERNMHVRRLGG